MTQRSGARSRPQVGCGGFARPPIRLGVEAHLLSLTQTAHPGALDCGSVHEHVLAAAIGRNESETFVDVEEFAAEKEIDAVDLDHMLNIAAVDDFADLRKKLKVE